MVGGIVLLARWLGDGPGACLSAAFAVLGGIVFIVHLAGTDGYVLPVLVDDLAAAEDPQAVPASASALMAFDQALLNLAVLLFIGAAFLSLGLAIPRAQVFALWIRWAAIAAKVAGLVLGAMLHLDRAQATANYLFRAAALVATVSVVEEVVIDEVVLERA